MLLYQQGRAVLKGVELGWGWRDRALLKGQRSSFSRLLAWRERMPRVPASNFSKDGQNEDFLTYKYQKLNFLGSSGVNL